MITLVVGHRGTGKTVLLARLRSYYHGKSLRMADLDAFIETELGMSVAQLFERNGEAWFRKTERKLLDRLVESLREESGVPAFIAAGAGFEGPVPSGVSCLWLRRATDKNGRIFLDRPRLESSKNPLSEFLSRYEEREKRFLRLHDAVLSATEGFSSSNAEEERYFLGKIEGLGGALSLLPENFSTLKRWRDFLASRLGWGLGTFEIRDDLLTPDAIARSLSAIPKSQLLASFRSKKRPFAPALMAAKGIRCDWALELGPVPDDLAPAVVSLHERTPSETIERALERLTREGRGSILKAAPIVDNFDELKKGHNWARQDEEKRCFLPRSKDGRWAWYRLRMKGQSPLNFIREGAGTGPDQPTLMDWMRQDAAAKSFAAVLGDPIDHSLSTAEHLGFFRDQNLSMLRIRVGAEEWGGGALEVLRRLGLCCAAVTSPLKLHAFEACKQRSPEAERLRSVNTMIYDDALGGWRGHNTDLSGLRVLLENIPAGEETAVWGGGGTLPLTRSLLPDAVFYSARTGEPRTKLPNRASPSTVVWASGRRPGAAFPPANWRPRSILDLNYTEDSPGLEYAQMTGAEYVSGLAMFRAQAKKQRAFWESYGSQSFRK